MGLIPLHSLKDTKRWIKGDICPEIPKWQNYSLSSLYSATLHERVDKDSMITGANKVIILEGQWEIGNYTRHVVSNKTSSLLILLSFFIFHSSASCMFLWPLRGGHCGSSITGSSRSNRTPRGNVRDEGEVAWDRQFAPFLHHTPITTLSTWSHLWHYSPLPAQQQETEGRWRADRGRQQ